MGPQNPKGPLKKKGLGRSLGCRGQGNTSIKKGSILGEGGTLGQGRGCSLEIRIVGKRKSIDRTGPLRLPPGFPALSPCQKSYAGPNLARLIAEEDSILKAPHRGAFPTEYTFQMPGTVSGQPVTFTKRMRQSRSIMVPTV